MTPLAVVEEDGVYHIRWVVDDDYGLLLGEYARPAPGYWRRPISSASSPTSTSMR